MIGPGEDADRQLYDRFWSKAHIWSPTVWPEWVVVRELLLPENGRVLEIGAGKRPRVPIEHSFFADLSWEAGYALAQLGSKAVVADGHCLPFCSSYFDLIVAAEILEHINDDQGALKEWNRVLKRGGQLVLTVPLHSELWTAFDRMVGHVRRYEPADLQDKLERARFRLERCVVGRVPLYRRTKQLEAVALTINPRLAMWLEDRLLMPLAIRLRRRIRRLDWHTQLAQENMAGAAAMLAVCVRP
jgi:SAM-dependent methyltransferase